MKLAMIEDTFIRIDLEKLARNYDRARAMLGDGVAIMAVVKANAYGHGAVKIAPTLISRGATYLAVARLSEAMTLREAYPECPLFVLGATPDALLKTAVENDITLTCFSARQAKLLGETALSLNKTAKIHIKLETGLNRLGSDDVDELYSICTAPGVYVEGAYSHLAQQSRASDEVQFARFTSIVSALEARGISFRYKHIADSIVSVDSPDFRLNMVRIGAILYGMKSFESDIIKPEPVLSMETRIVRLRTIPKGEGVGYDFTWRAPRESVIATLPFGYCDGYPAALNGVGYVTVRGVRCPFVGRMCMDLCVADVTDVPGVTEGDRVIIYGDGSGNALSVTEAAALIHGNKNGMMAQLMTRPARVYEGE